MEERQLALHLIHLRRRKVQLLETNYVAGARTMHLKHLALIVAAEGGEELQVGCRRNVIAAASNGTEFIREGKGRGVKVDEDLNHRGADCGIAL